MDAKILDYAFFEGEIVPFSEANVSIGTHALQYGTGAFAGIRGYLDADGSTINIFRLPDHAERLLNSGKLLRAELPYGKDDVVRIICRADREERPEWRHLHSPVHLQAGGAAHAAPARHRR